jgi:predicted GH43/DUF377 family glycosyl hydrolase
MKRHCGSYVKVLAPCVLLAMFVSVNSVAQSKAEVPASKMQAIYNEVKTPFKYGMIIVPKSDSQKLDCPTVFRKNNMWYMTYIIFGGKGYETWLAKSKDLLTWQTMGRILSHSADTTIWDAQQKAGYPSLIDTKWGGDYNINKYNNKYWMSYFGGNASGYEAGLLSLGMAYTTNDPRTVHEWQRLDKPIMMSTDKDVRWWENKKQFKSTVIWDKQQTTGYPFVMYYNANGDTAKDNKKTRWFERIGMAVSKDMINWKRNITEPIVHHPVGITGDPMIQKIGDVWVMFYFGAFWQDRKGAFNRFACSYNLINWTDWTGDNLVQSSEPYDERYAHKSYVVKWKGVVYHFYNAVNNKEQRGIAVATSKDMGKSKVQFVSNK